MMQPSHNPAKWHFFCAWAVAAQALVLASCSVLQLDKETNCLNDKAACFKTDKTRPKVDSFQTQPVRDITNSVSELQYIDVTFTEEVKDGEKASTFRFKPNAAVHNFSITSVSKVAQYTYRLFVGGALINTGLVELDISPITDYNNNSMDTATPVEFNGNVNIPIVSSVNHNGVSTAGGYASVDLKFYHNYTADVTNANSYQVRLTSGAIDCSGGTLLTSGSNLVPGVANEITWNVPAASFASGMNRLVVCISNANNPNAANSASWPIIRDDVAPILTYTPAGGSYKDPQPVTLTCSNNADKIAYSTTTQQGSAPADPPTPVFDPATGNVTTGSLYSGSVTAENPANPTYTKFTWRCIDIAGNLSTALVTPVQFYIDNTIPGVSVNLASGYRQYVSAVNTTTTLTFTTDQVSKAYNIRRNGTTCDTGGDGTVLATGVTPATAGQTITVPLDITTHFTASNTTYPVRICVAGTGILWGTAYLEITRDDTVPTITPTVVSGSYGSLQSVQFTCDDAFGSVQSIAYVTTEADGLSVPAAPASPAYDTATGGIMTGLAQTGPLSPADRKTTRYAFSCIDRAGNVSTVGNVQYTIDATLPLVNFVSLNRTAVTTNAGAYNDTTLVFTANRDNVTYRIRRVADCNHAGTPSETIASGTVSAINTNQSVLLGAALFPTNGVTYPIRICVYNLLGASSHQTASVSVTRDDTYPTFAGLTTLSAGTAGQFTLNWSAATDGGSNVAIYNIYRSTSSSGPFVGAAHVVAHPNASISVTVPDPLQTYYYVAGAVDNAGNETKVVAAVLSTKPSVRLVVTGLGAGKTFTFLDGTGASQVVNANVASPGILFATTLALSQTYNLSISVQPAGQVCAIKEKQFGTLSADLTVNINCADGVLVAGHFQDKPAALMAFALYRTAATVQASSFNSASFGNPNSLTVANGNIYFGTDVDCDTAAGTQYCLFSVPMSGSTVTAVITGLTSVVRGVTSDGSNLYYTTLAPDNRLYKYPLTGGAAIEIASGFNNPHGIALDANYVYVSDRGNKQIVRVDIQTGAQQVVISGLSAGPLALTVAGNNLYFTLESTHAIFRVAKAGGTETTVFGKAAVSGREDNTGVSARLNAPHDLVFDGYDNIYFAEYGGHVVRRANLTSSRVTTLAGDGVNGLYQNGTGTATRISAPVGIATDGRRLFIGLHGADKRIVRLTDSGLRGYWPLTSTTGLNDYNSDNSTLNNLSWITGSTNVGSDRFGKPTAVLFDGTSNAIQATSPLVPGSACNVSLATWFRATNPATGNSQVIAHVGDTGTSGYGLVVTSTGELSALFGGVNFLNAGFQVVANDWTHAALVCRGSNIWSLYVNGHLLVRGDGSATKRPNSNNTPLIAIGKGSGGSTEYLAGAISDVRLYSRALGEGEINELAQYADSNQVGKSYNGRPTELLLHYTFDQLSTSDIGALGYNIINSSAAPVNGIEGDYPGAVGLDGTSGSYLYNTAAPGLPTGAQPRAVCAFVRPNQQPATGVRYPVVSFGSTSTIFKGTELVYYNNTGSDYRISFTKIGDSVDAQVTLPVLSWSHLCASNDGTTTKLYYNGGEVATVAGNAQTFDSLPGALRIGKRVYDAEVYNFNGQIDDVRIYNKALTAFEIRQLATAVPVGLVHHYDFVGDTSDTSGLANDLTNSGASPTDDRFGLNSRAYKFSGSGDYLYTSLLRNAYVDITFSAWINPQTIASSYTGIVDNWDGSGGTGGGTGGGLVLNTSGQLLFLAKGNNADSDCNTSFIPPKGVYTHVAATVDTATLNIKVYADGALLATCAIGNKPVFRNSTNLRVSKSVWASTFEGLIDDVRIYNRALSASEVQALIQQPNKRIYRTSYAYNGALMGNGGVALAPTSLVSGVAGADAKCNWSSDSNKPSGVTGFKAMLTDNSLRRPCTSSNCSGGPVEHTDWVLRSGITYVRTDGTTILFTANTNGVFDFGAGGNTYKFKNSIATAANAWTGLTSDWKYAGSCSAWTDSSCAAGASLASASAIDSGALTTMTVFGGSAPLYCVEQ